MHPSPAIANTYLQTSNPLRGFTRYGFCFLCLLLLLLVGSLCSFAQSTPTDNRRPSVLTLHSYTSNDWCDGLQAGINHVLLDPLLVDMYVDHMDSRKVDTPEYLEIFSRILDIKYRNIHFDLIIACDDNAYKFANQYRQTLWPATPVVFCGVNEFRPQEFATHENLTGISENNDLRPLANALPQIVPGLKTLFIVRDASMYARDTLPHLLEALHEVTPRLQIQYLDTTLTAEELTQRLTLAPPDSAVFFLCFWEDKTSRYISTNEARRILSHCAVPVFTTQQNLIGYGAMGGTYVDAFDHGAAAAEIARRVIAGTPISAIPAAIGPARRITFDYALLEHFHVKPAALPAESAIVNEPFSFYRKYRALVWATISTITILATLVCLLVINVLQRRRAVARLTESEEKFSRAFNDSPVSMAIRDLETNCYIEVNERCITTLGYTRTEVIGHSPQEIGWVSEADMIELKPLLTNATGWRDRETQFRHKDGRTILCSYSAHAVRIAGRNRLLSIMVDISAHKKAEAEREKLQAQLNQIQKMESIGRLAGGVAHDFNNMLTAIQINASLAREDAPPGSPSRESLDEILQCTRRSADLTQRLLAFARKQTIAPQVLDLNATVEGTLKMLHRLIGESIGLHWQPGPGLWPVKFDPGQADQVLTNLCVNARDAIKGIGNVTIRTQNTCFDAEFCAHHSGYSAGDYVQFTVSDDGSGMEKEVLDHLFEPFFTTKNIGQGTGLGLATVYGIVKQNQGFINVYSEPGHGTTFNIYLPRYSGNGELSKPTETLPPTSRGTETILLVEDEPSILRISKRSLENLGYTVIAAGSPLEAIELAAQHAGKINLLITDVVMPEMNGRDLTQKLLGLYPTIKCLYISGYTADVIARQGVLEQDIHFLQKPFTIQDLSRKVRASLNEPPIQ